MTAKWFVIRTATRQEKRAQAALTELGLEAYMPAETRWWRHARKREPKDYPLFAGYIFARLTPQQIYFAVEADGVYSVISNNGQPTPVDPLFIGAMVYFESLGAFDRTAADRAIKPPLKIGEDVVVAAGQYAGFIGQVLELRGRNRALLLVSLFGRAQKIERPIAELRLATDSAPVDGDTQPLASMRVAC